MVIMDYEEDEWPSTSWRFNWSQIHLGFALGWLVHLSKWPWHHKCIRSCTENASGLLFWCSCIQRYKWKMQKYKKTLPKALRNQALTTLTESTIGKIKQSLSHHTNQTHIAVIVNGEILVKLQLGLVWQRAKIYVTTDKSMYQLGEIYVTTLRNLGPTSTLFQLGPQLVS